MIVGVGMGFDASQDPGQSAPDIDREFVSRRREFGKPRIHALVRRHHPIERRAAPRAGNQVALHHPPERGRAGFFQVSLQIGLSQTRHHSALPYRLTYSFSNCARALEISMYKESGLDPSTSA